MMTPTPPPLSVEQVRLAALHATGLDMSPDPAFDDLTKLATQLCGWPHACILLVDRERTWCKSHVGPRPPDLPRHDPFADLLVRESGTFECPDARHDPALEGSGLLSHTGIGACAGAALLDAEGCVLGALCLLSPAPSHLSAAARLALATLSRQVGTEIDLWRRTAELSKLAIVAAATSNGVVILRPDGDIEWVNEGRARLFGRDIRSMIGRYPEAALIGDETDRRALGRLEEHLRSGEPCAEELALRLRAGEPLWLSVSTTPVRAADGSLQSTIVIETDITPLKYAEHQKDEFVAMVAHELRTPLTAISASIDLLAAGSIGAMPPTAKRVFAIAQRSTHRMASLLDDLLDLERIRAGKLKLTLATHRGSDLATAAVAEMTPRAEASGVALRVDLVTDRHVLADRDRSLQVLANLLANAVRFSETGGLVVLRVEPAEAPGRLRFSICDEGGGIPTEQLQQLFGHFQQLPGAAGHGKGTGLGLAISKLLVELQSGEIGVTSRLGTGSTFWFELPASELRGEQAPDP